MYIVRIFLKMIIIEFVDGLDRKSIRNTGVKGDFKIWG